MNIQFNSVKELYNKVLPALKTKKRQMQKKGISVKEIDIFNYLIKTKWRDSNNLSLNEIVNDILNYNGNIITY